MCEPVTLLMVAGAGIAAAGQAKASGAASKAGFQQALGSLTQAKAYDKQARREVEAGEWEAERTGRELERIKGSMANAYLSTGIALDGSPSEVIKDTAREGALDIAAIRWNAAVRAESLLQQGDMAVQSGRSAMAGAKAAGEAGMFNAAAGLTTSLAGAYKNYQSFAVGGGGAGGKP